MICVQGVGFEMGCEATVPLKIRKGSQDVMRICRSGSEFCFYPRRLGELLKNFKWRKYMIIFGFSFLKEDTSCW
jgi:hypothetical protein